MGTIHQSTNDWDPLLLLDAARFAEAKHRGQSRKDAEQTPYITHPLKVAAVLAEAGVTDAQILAAALLHDTIEDTETTGEELEEHFGDRIRSMVEHVTDDKSLPKAERKRLQIEHADSLPPGAAMIKIADKICNIEDVANDPPVEWPRKRRTEYLDWAEKVVSRCRGGLDALDKRFDEALANAREKLEAKVTLIGDGPQKP